MNNELLNTDWGSQVEVKNDSAGSGIELTLEVLKAKLLN